MTTTLTDTPFATPPALALAEEITETFRLVERLTHRELTALHQLGRLNFRCDGDRRQTETLRRGLCRYLSNYYGPGTLSAQAEARSRFHTVLAQVREEHRQEAESTARFLAGDCCACGEHGVASGPCPSCEVDAQPDGADATGYGEPRGTGR
jgi:hypothetical protein